MAIVDTYRKRCESTRQQLEQERSSYVPHWIDLAENLSPWRGKFLVGPQGDGAPGRKRNSKILIGHARYALRTLTSGCQAGITNQSKEWAGLTTGDPDMAKYGPVKEWLHTAMTTMFDTFRGSNIYNMLHVGWGDIGCFGTGAMCLESDADTIIRTKTLPIGSYAFSANERGIVDTCVRTYKMTTRQIVGAFGFEGITDTVRAQWDRGDYHTWHDVCHLIQPNEEYDPRSALSRNKRFSSCYWLVGSDEDKWLRKSGFDRFPILIPRWEIDGEDVWGHGPGMDALPDVRQAYSMVRKKAKAIDKMVDPPLVAGPEMRNSVVSSLPSAITFANFRDGKPSVSTLHQVVPPVQELREDIGEIKRDISRAFYEDVFLMLANSDRREITAREVEELAGEKLIMLGPALARMDVDLLNPLIDWTFQEMLERDLLPPPPQELQGEKLKVEFVNPLALAQKAMGIGGLESLVGLVTGIAPLKGDILDKIDLDLAVDEYGTKRGVNPRIIRSDEQVAAIRQQRAQAQAQAAQAEQLATAAGAAKDLSQASTTGDNALAGILRGLQPQRN